MSTHKAFNIHKQAQQVENIFQTLNKTIHQAAPFIEYAVDRLSSKFSKVKCNIFC